MAPPQSEGGPPIGQLTHVSHHYASFHLYGERNEKSARGKEGRDASPNSTTEEKANMVKQAKNQLKGVGWT